MIPKIIEERDFWGVSDIFQMKMWLNWKRVVVILNVYDNGYRAKMVAWRTGKQLVLQPEWAESDKRFRRDQTLLSASVAADRGGGGERAVKVCKWVWYISRGFLPNMSPKQLNKAWTTWSFQANLILNPVL